MAKHPSFRRETRGAIDDLYDYLRDPPRRLTSSRQVESLAWTVTDDWHSDVPVIEAEIDVFEAWFGDVFDALLGPGR